MKLNDSANIKQTEKNDKRVTRIGKFLRRTSLDEFPQFFNVFNGEMSIVGPRPHMVKHTDEYSKLIEKYMVRQFIKPGITGLAQVNGYRGETKNIHQMQKRIEYDIWYLENWSLKTDLKIVFKTVYNAIKGEENAY
jgi:putative colanic acid biosynthesis UDP-glucose lipid carrier transferase